MTNTFNPGRILLDRMEWSNYLTTHQVDHFTQMTHWNLLHANQPVVPEATPAPGFERFTCLPQIVDQKIIANKAAVEFQQKKSFLDDLYGFDGDEVEALFNGIQSDYPAFNLYPLKFEDTNQLPDPTVFDMMDETPNTPCPPGITTLVKQDEVKCSAYGDSGYCSSPGSFPCSPPCSPSISEAGSNTSSTDEGIHSEISDLEYIDEFLGSMDRSAGSAPLSSPKEVDKQTVKQESALPAVPAIPLKLTGKRKRGPRPLVRYRGDGPTIQLWQFLLELLLEPKCSKLIQWTQDDDYEFKILQTAIVAKMWGKKKNKPTMNYEKLSRGIRYYYGNSVIEKVRGKRYVYRFLCDIPKILGSDPMAKKYEESMEDSVCGEALMSTEDRDLLGASSVEDGVLAVKSLDFSVLC